jgi:opacity protein-like surface antigen
MKSIYLIVLLIALLANSLFSQKVVYDPGFFPFVSVNAGKYGFGSFGYAFYGETLDTDFPTSYKIYLANEIKLDNELLIGPKVGGWATFNFISAGVGLICYTDFSGYAFKLRPEAGFEFRSYKLTYGYNATIGYPTLWNVNTNLVEFTYLFKRSFVYRQLWKGH